MRGAEKAGPMNANGKKVNVERSRQQRKERDDEVPGERADEPGDIMAAPQGKGGQLQAGDPALGTVLKRGDVFRREVETHRRVEERGGFEGGEAQVRGAQFGQ